MVNPPDSPTGGVVGGLGAPSAVVGASVVNDVRAEVEEPDSPTGGVIGGVGFSAASGQ